MVGFGGRHGATSGDKSIVFSVPASSGLFTRPVAASGPVSLTFILRCRTYPPTVRPPVLPEKRGSILAQNRR